MKALLLFSFFAIPAFAQTPSGPVIYEYKKYEKFDLGNLEVKGELLAPGDVTVRERERESLHFELFERKHSEDLARKDLDSLR